MVGEGKGKRGKPYWHFSSTSSPADMVPTYKMTVSLQKDEDVKTLY